MTRLREIAAFIDGGLNIAGIKRVLRLQDEVRRLQAEVEHLTADAEEPRPTGQVAGPGAINDKNMCLDPCYNTALFGIPASGQERTSAPGGEKRPLDAVLPRYGSSRQPLPKACPKPASNHLVPHRSCTLARMGELLGYTRAHHESRRPTYRPMH